MIFSSDAARFEGYPSALSHVAWHRPKRKNCIYFWAAFLVKPGKDGGTADDNTNGNFGVGPETHEGQVVCHIWRQSKFPRVVSTHDGCNTGTGRALIVSKPWLIDLLSKSWLRAQRLQKTRGKDCTDSNLFLQGSCNFQTDLMGRIKIAKSEITLNTPVDLKRAVKSKQCPCFINGFQAFSRGLHMNIMKEVCMR